MWIVRNSNNGFGFNLLVLGPGHCLFDDYTTRVSSVNLGILFILIVCPCSMVTVFGQWGVQIPYVQYQMTDR